MGITNKDVLKTVAIDVPNLKTQMDNMAYQENVDIKKYISQILNGQGGQIFFNVIGDSITNGEGIPKADEEYQWATIIKNTLAYNQESNGCGKYESVTNLNTSRRLSSQDLIFSSGITFNNVGNSGLFSATMSVGSTITFNRNINLLLLKYLQDVGQGSIEIRVNGTLKNTIACNGATAKYKTSKTYYFEKQSTYELKCVGNPVTINSIGTFLNTSTMSNLIAFNRMAYSGVSAITFTETTALEHIKNCGSFDTNTKDIYFFAIGTNDMLWTSQTLDSYKNVLKTHINNIKDVGYPMLWIPPQIDTSKFPIKNGKTYEEWKKAIYEVAIELNVSVVDCSKIDFVKNGYLTDGVHPNREGHMAIAQIVADTIGIKIKNNPKELKTLTIDCSSVTWSNDGSFKFTILSQLPNTAIIVDMYVKHKTNLYRYPYKEVANYSVGKGFYIVPPNLAYDIRWSIFYNTVNGFVDNTQHPYKSNIPTVITDVILEIQYLN